VPPNKREGFAVFKIEAIDDGSIMLTGNNPTRALSKGKRKGKADFKSGGQSLRVIVTADEYKAAIEFVQS
jgi:hypothetical protein